MPQGEVLRKVKVVSRSKDGNDEIKHSCNHNLFLNNLIYVVEFPDGEIKEFSANISVENTHAQLDDDSNSMQILDVIDDCSKDINSVGKADTRLLAKSG